ncbi:hypothetical protein ABV838_004742 [Escherichia coli]|nr:hypothetical protein [Escherichia coli]EEV6544575.1 hypothetical protein [Escherichia coli]EFA2753863.1 hypothetical protein [Escherichia coli]EFC6026043.1 hypothetical protein [Escherichia coli]EFK9542683.1 hypothetical protein [Escherichia coli]
MTRSLASIKHALEQARRERDAWQRNRGGSHHHKMASLLVESWEKELSEAIKNQSGDDHKQSDSA